MDDINAKVFDAANEPVYQAEPVPAHPAQVGTTALTEQEQKIIRENGMDPARFCVTFRDETTIVLRNYKTRDDITIHQGDKKWSARQ